jgi:AcrR family transcriptional regulator
MQRTMANTNSEQLWIEAGYNQFVDEGLEGIRVERLARIINLNKSGYYHYFGNQDTYLKKLMDYHLKQAEAYMNDLKQVQHFDPEYIELLIKYTRQLMFTNQLIKNRKHNLFFETLQAINEMLEPVLSNLFADFIGFKDHQEFSAKYFNQVRYMFHAQIIPEHMTYEYLRDFMYQARDLAQQAVAIAAKNNSQQV